MSRSELLAGWCRAVMALSPDTERSAVSKGGQELLTRWAEPHRRYHTAQHLSEMLLALDELATATKLSAQDHQVTVVAAWLHDAVYDVKAAPGDSERASADLARKLLPSLGIAAPATHLVEQLILLTIDHGTQLPGALADAFTDADLAILAASPRRFDEYCAQVRDEYGHVPDDVYADGRTAILRDLVDRPEVYRTAHARAAWTGSARQNVARELTRLRTGLGE